MTDEHDNAAQYLRLVEAHRDAVIAEGHAADALEAAQASGDASAVAAAQGAYNQAAARAESAEAQWSAGYDAELARLDGAQERLP